MAEPPLKYDEVYNSVRPEKEDKSGLQPFTQTSLPLHPHNASQTPYQSLSPARSSRLPEQWTQSCSKRQDQTLSSSAVQAQPTRQDPKPSRSSVHSPSPSSIFVRVTPNGRPMSDNQDVLAPDIPGAWPDELDLSDKWHPLSSIVIAVFGMTGTGKPTFIGKVMKQSVGVGHGLRSCKCSCILIS